MQPSPRPTTGTIAATLLALTLVACAAVTGSPGASPTQAAPSATPDATTDASASASPTPHPDAPHPAAGLGMVRFPDPELPIGQIYVVTRDGDMREVTNAGENPLGAGGLVWSPDGSQIAFVSASHGAGAFPSVFVVNADGSELRTIDQLAEEEFSWPFAWSPDGSQLLYHDTLTSGEQRIWLADVASSDVRQVGTGAGPAWFPDGERISFIRGVPGLVEEFPEALTQVVFVMELGGRPRQFARATRAVWSPDATRVLIEEDHARLLIADADGSNRRELVAGGAPVWSPDGSRIAYTTPVNEEHGQPFLAVVDPDGREIWSGVVGTAPSWSPDGTRLAVEIRYPDLTVAVLDAETGELLWQEAGTGPRWRP